MAVARWGRTGLIEEGPALRWGRAGVDGTALVSPKVRWGRDGLTGVAAVILAPIAPQTVEPESIVTVSAPLQGGGFADSYTWRVVSGMPVTFSGTGGTRTFRAPSTMPPNGGQTVIGVRGTKDGTTSPEVTVTITLLPQVSWMWSGTAWVGRRPLVTL